MLNYSILLLQIFHFVKKMVSTAYAVYRKSLLQTFKLLILGFFFIFMNAISNPRTEIYADNGSPCLVPLANLK